jgi:hypothetical protein
VQRTTASLRRPGSMLAGPVTIRESRVVCTVFADASLASDDGASPSGSVLSSARLLPEGDPGCEATACDVAAVETEEDVLEVSALRCMRDRFQVAAAVLDRRIRAFEACLAGSAAELEDTKRVDKIHSSLTAGTLVSRIFHLFDKDEDELLSPDEFGALVSALGGSFNPRKLPALCAKAGVACGGGRARRAIASRRFLKDLSDPLAGLDDSSGSEDASPSKTRKKLSVLSKEKPLPGMSKPKPAKSPRRPAKKETAVTRARKLMEAPLSWEAGEVPSLLHAMNLLRRAPGDTAKGTSPAPLRQRQAHNLHASLWGWISSLDLGEVPGWSSRGGVSVDGLYRFYRLGGRMALLADSIKLGVGKRQEPDPVACVQDAADALEQATTMLTGWQSQRARDRETLRRISERTEAADAAISSTREWGMAAGSEAQANSERLLEAAREASRWRRRAETATLHSVQVQTALDSAVRKAQEQEELIVRLRLKLAEFDIDDE